MPRAEPSKFPKELDENYEKNSGVTEGFKNGTSGEGKFFFLLRDREKEVDSEVYLWT
jgi:hypothetical protein